MKGLSKTTLALAFVFILAVLFGSFAVLSRGGNPQESLSSKVGLSKVAVSGQIFVNSPCPEVRDPSALDCGKDKPFVGSFIIANRATSKEIAHFDTDSSGKFSLVIPAGDYTIAPVKGNTIPYAFSVSSEKNADLLITFDTGIR